MTKVYTGEKKVVICIEHEYGNRVEYIPILEKYESYSDWYWYITEFDGEDEDIAFGLIHGIEDEWDTIYMPELRDTYNIRKVPKKNWPFNSRVKMILEDQLREPIREEVKPKRFIFEDGIGKAWQ